MEKRHKEETWCQALVQVCEAAMEERSFQRNDGGYIWLV
jgi:hypothetical protein